MSDQKKMTGPERVDDRIGIPAVCRLPPPGWVCTRPPPHDGPCAAVPIDAAPSEALREGWRLIDAEEGRRGWHVLGSVSRCMVTKIVGPGLEVRCLLEKHSDAVAHDFRVDGLQPRQAPRMTFRRVVLESPYALDGKTDRNVRYARRAVRDALLRGEAPVASHLLYTQPGVLDDTVPEESEAGIEAGLAWVTVAQATVVYQDHGISYGMQRGIARAVAARQVVEYRQIGPEPE